MRQASARVILATSNGTGMGHLARQAAVALALPEAVEPVIFSLSQAVHVVARDGLRAEYCPSNQRDWIPHLSWHDYLCRRLTALIAETGAKVVVFDGVSPYLGLLRARAAHRQVAFCWMRRGMWRPGANRRALAARPFFDVVVEPGDLAAGADRGATADRTDAITVPPVTILERVLPLPRSEAAKALGLDPDVPTALVTLGAGAINDAVTPAVAAIRCVLANPGWQVAVTRAPLARTGLPAEQAARVHELLDIYPLARYLSAFDAAVSAAGYNAVHELIPAGVPTVLVPNASTATDDQQTRARALADAGLALWADEQVPDSIAAAVRTMLDPAARAALSSAGARLPAPTGASATAEIVAGLTTDFTGHRATTVERLRRVDFEARAAAMRALGPTGTALVRRALGRRPPAGPRRPLTVRPLLTDKLDPATLQGDHPVEHLLAGSSDAYHARRLAIAHAFYDWGADVSSPTRR